MTHSIYNLLVFIKILYRIAKEDERRNLFYLGILAHEQPSEELKEKLGYDVAIVEDSELGIFELRYPPIWVSPLLKYLLPVSEAKGLKPKDNEISGKYFCLRRPPQQSNYLFESD